MKISTKGRYALRIMIDLAQHDEDHGTNKGQRDQQPVVTTLGIEDQIEPEQDDADQAADNGTEEAVSAIELGVLQVAAHTEDSADTGERRTSVGKKGVNQCTNGRCQGSFKITHSNFRNTAKNFG